MTTFLNSKFLVLCFLIVLASSVAVPARAQDDDDAVLKPGEPDFSLISLPTSLRVPKYKSAFRVTHRFTRPLSCKNCPNNLLEDFFGLDSGARIGLEYRFGLLPRGQIGIHRTSDKTIEFFGQYGLSRQSGGSPVETSILVAVDGTDNFQAHRSPAIGLIVTRLLGDRGALHVEPIWVRNTNLFEPAVSDDGTFVLGLGARARLRGTMYLVGEFAPRVAGYSPGTHHGSFGFEKRLGGHMFQVNVSNSFGTALTHVARGALQRIASDGSTETDWYLGFNISRKFF